MGCFFRAPPRAVEKHGRGNAAAAAAAAAAADREA